MYKRGVGALIHAAVQRPPLPTAVLIKNTATSYKLNAPNRALAIHKLKFTFSRYRKNSPLHCDTDDRISRVKADTNRYCDRTARRIQMSLLV